MRLAQIIAFAAMMGMPPAPYGEAGEAAPYLINPASRVSFVAVQAGSPFSGTFESFDARIVFNGEALAHSSFEVRINLKSVNTEYADRDEILRGVDFFDVAAHPDATFIASQFAARDEAGSFVASGVLTIKGVAQALELPFNFSSAADVTGRWVLKGSVPINRLDFGVGTGEWRDPKWIGHEVTVSFELLLDSSER